MTLHALFRRARRLLARRRSTFVTAMHPNGYLSFGAYPYGTRSRRRARP